MGTVAFILILVSLVLILNRQKKKTTQQQVSSYITPTKKPYDPSEPLPDSKTIKQIPTLAPQQGAGVDIQSAPAEASKQELKKIRPFLPFSKEVKVSDTITASILIPSADLQTNQWSLNVDISGINYRVANGTPEYTTMRNAFRIAADEVFYFLKSNGVDTTKLAITWGSRKFIQDRALEWLK